MAAKKILKSVQYWTEFSRFGDMTEILPGLMR